MNLIQRSKRLISATILAVLTVHAAGSDAAQLPGAADAGRVNIDHKPPAPGEMPERIGTTAIPLPGAKIPEGAEKIKLKLTKIKVDGMTAFPKKEIEGLYSKYLNTEITLDQVWKIADSITQHYQQAGYFLSQAFVPEQKISGGTFRIKVVEGYIGKVELNDPIAENSIVRQLIKRILKERPARAEDIESILLRLNDLPGVSFRSVMKPMGDGPSEDDAVKLILIKERKEDVGSISFDNFTSKYLGPYEETLSYQASIIPLHNTSVSALLSNPVKKLQYYNLSHEMTLFPGISMQLYGGYTEANPGFTLRPKDIDSRAENLGINIKDQFIRQRLENLSVSAIFDVKNNYSNVLEAPLTRDRVRAARANVAYDRSDPLDGYEFFNLTFSQGLGVFDSSSAGDKFISRTGAKPDFSKLEYSVSRTQGFGEDVALTTAVFGQVADKPLYSSEQFGYGGQSVGRAFDPSEFLGDNGLEGSAELSYSGVPTWQGVSIAPFLFYDLGKVWDNDSTTSAFASSTGGGIKLGSTLGLTGNLTIAEPLVRRIEDPTSGNGKNPRILFQTSVKF